MLARSILTRSSHSAKSFHDDGLEVKHPVLSAVVEHGVLSGDLVYS